ncbi:MAG: hypothetical protein QG572_1936 [Pseudomonadota bacterium]|nr:hypothetical protein [Pseudomonadota bacterium]
MARARNIKPSFFKNELLAEMDAFDRLLFIGLWCLADREGRIEDRPKRIKMELFPCDTYDVNAGLDQLTKHGFLRRYQAGDAAVVSIVNFHKHQTPHGTEKDSELPDETGALTVHDRSENGYVTGKKRRNNVKPEQSTGQERLSDSVSPVKTQGENTLNPDSLNPDSLKEAKASLSASAKPTDDEPDDGVPPCPFDKLIDSYKKHLPELPDVRRSLFAGGKNGKAMRSRWRWVLTAKHERGPRIGERLAESAQDGLAWFDRYFAFVADSDFLTGKSGAFTGCDLGWLVNAANFEKVLSGKYHAEKREAANA